MFDAPVSGINQINFRHDMHPIIHIPFLFIRMLASRQSRVPVLSPIPGVGTGRFGNRLDGNFKKLMFEIFQSGPLLRNRIPDTCLTDRLRSASLLARISSGPPGNHFKPFSIAHQTGSEGCLCFVSSVAD